MEKKNNSSLLVGLLLGSIIALLVVGGLFATGNISFKKTTTDNEQTSENNKNIKVNETKDYVYDADYKYDNKYTEFNRTNEEREDYTIDYYGIAVQKSGKEYLKDLKVPYININSNDAQTANSDLEKLYLKYAKEFDECVDEVKNTNGPGCSQILTYRTYSYSNILSVVVIDSTQATSPYVFQYNIYNFDLTTGNKISYENMLSILGYNKETITNNIKTAIHEEMGKNSKGVPNDDISKACIYEGKERYKTTNCYEIADKLLEETISNNTILYFADNEGTLNILPILYYDFVQNGTANHYLIKITK